MKVFIANNKKTNKYRVVKHLAPKALLLRRVFGIHAGIELTIHQTCSSIGLADTRNSLYQSVAM